MRRRRAEKRQVTPDPKYGSELVSRFMNVVRVEGKKQVAERLRSARQRNKDMNGIGGEFF